MTYYVKTFCMLSVQPFYSWTLRFPLLIISDGPSGRLYDGQFLKPFETELSYCSSSVLLRLALVCDFLVALSSFRTWSTFDMVIGFTFICSTWSFWCFTYLTFCKNFPACFRISVINNNSRFQYLPLKVIPKLLFSGWRNLKTRKLKLLSMINSSLRCCIFVLRRMHMREIRHALSTMEKSYCKKAIIVYLILPMK
jgi:hypothetical protein